ncbi:hypothetical protein SLA2020_141510 [Shorea laevis]
MARKRKRGGGTVRDKTEAYETQGKQRIKENTERMHKLGIFDLSLKLKPPSDLTSRNVSSANNKTRNPLALSEPPRRSSRLMTLPPVNYRDKRPKRSILSDEETVVGDKDESFVYVNIRQDEEEGTNCRKNSLREADFNGKKVGMKIVQWMDFLGKELVEIRELATSMAPRTKNWSFRFPQSGPSLKRLFVSTSGGKEKPEDERAMAKKRGERGEGTAGEGGGEYEKMREKRIQENTERMQKLGIFDLSLKLKAPTSKTNRKVSSSTAKKTKSHRPLSDPPRRSSRLKTLPSVSYKEVRPERNMPSGSYEICIKEGEEPEIYTEEHEKLLGDCKTPWTLSVDGYGKDGKRIYDQVNGKSCHQCRLKTLGHHTRCSKCDMVQGQFCGDCLSMRYGENVIEANQNPNWICPVCRGVCNCSRCRRGKGWAITGDIYRKVVKMGYKSVAHYLIQTRRGMADTKSKEIFYVDESSDGSPGPQAEKNGDDLEDKELYCLNSKHDGYNRIDDNDDDGGDGDYDCNDGDSDGDEEEEGEEEEEEDGESN